VDAGDIRQLPDNVALINALQAKRIDLVFQDHAGIERVYKQRALPVDVVFPVSDAPEHGSGCAFRRQDADFLAAFQKELRAMKASGEFLAVLHKYGFDMTPDQMRIDGTQACTLGG
jgi:polar amino acid transport system substrate-binding protein